MAGIVWQANIVDTQGNVLPAANVEVRHQLSGALATIYADYDLLNPINNPTQSDPLGFVRFFVASSGLYRISASKGGFTRQWTHVALIAVPTGATIPTGIVTPPALTAGDNNNWNALISEEVGRVRLAGHASGSVITGMQGGVDGHRIILTNIGANTVTIRDESVSSTEANRFAMNGDMLLPTGTSAEFIYDGTLSRWSRIGN